MARIDPHGKPPAPPRKGTFRAKGRGRAILILLVFVGSISAQAQPKSRPQGRAPTGGGAPDTTIRFIASLASGVYDMNPAWSLSFPDVDRDGAPDLFVSNHLHTISRLYRNRGDGTFEEVTNVSGIREGMDDHDAAWGDLDNDGDPDLAVTNGYYREDRLFRNDGAGRFENITRAAGYAWGTRGRGRNVFFMDYDLDGHLDLFVSNCLGPCFLYWNDGGGRFTPDSREARLDASFRHMGACTGDLDGDGLFDLVLGGCALDQPLELLHNLGDRTFDERGRAAGLVTGEPAYGVIPGDFDNDGDLDLYVAPDTANRSGHLFRNRGDGTFEDVTRAAGLTGVRGKCPTGVFFDADNDGDLDLYVVRSGNYRNGPNLPDFLFENQGGGTFRDVTRAAGLDFAPPGNGTAAAVADVNGDGRLDLVTANGKFAVEPMGPTILYLNAGGRGNHFLRLVLEGMRSNRDGYGARVFLRAGGRLQFRQAGARAGYSQGERTLHFGLGQQALVEEVVIQWPSGTVQVLHDLPSDHTFHVREPPRHQWFGDTAEILALRGRPSRAAARCVESLAPRYPGPAETVHRSVPEAAARVERYRRIHAACSGAEPSGKALRAAYEGNLDRYRVPEGRILQVIALGRFPGAGGESDDEDPAALAGRVKSLLAEGTPASTIAHRLRLAFWREPVPGPGPEPRRGFAVTGFFTRPMLEEHFTPETAGRLWSAAPGSVLGPVRMVDPLSVPEGKADDDFLWVFRVGSRRPAHPVSFARVRAGIHACLARKARAAAEARFLATGEAAPPPEAGTTALLETELAAQALMERYVADARPTEAEAEAFFETHRDFFSQAPAIVAEDVMLRDPEVEAFVEKRRAKGETMERILRALKIPESTDPGARSGIAWKETLTLTPTRLQALGAEEGTYARLRSARPGEYLGPFEDARRRVHYLAKVRDHPGRRLPFATVRDRIRSRLLLGFVLECPLLRAPAP